MRADKLETEKYQRLSKERCNQAQYCIPKKVKNVRKKMNMGTKTLTDIVSPEGLEILRERIPLSQYI